jgi:hypothetical protein
MAMRVRQTGVFYEMLEAVTLMTMKITLFWDVMPSNMRNEEV